MIPKGLHTPAVLAEKGIEYADDGFPVLDAFSAYGSTFRERKVPELEDVLVTRLERLPNGFRLQLDSGETVAVRRVVLAVGITHFQYVAGKLVKLPSEFVSHSVLTTMWSRFGAAVSLLLELGLVRA